MDFAKKNLKKLIEIIKKPEMKILPGHLAFFMVLSIFPIITLCGYLASIFDVSLVSVVNLMNEILPSEVNELLIPYIIGSGMDIHVGFYVFIGYLVASNGAHSIIVSSNTLYGIDHASYLKRRIKALFLTILLVLLFIFTLFVLAFGNSILSFVLSFNFMGSFGSTFYYLFLLLKWPIAIIFIYVMIKLIFTISPDVTIRSCNTTKGAWFTTFTWIISTFVYSYYVLHFSNYDIFYGSLSNIIVMMMWVYILAYSLVIGIAINTQSYKENIRHNNVDSVNNK